MLPLCLVLLADACGGGNGNPTPDPCTGVLCSSRGFCVVAVGEPICACLRGYHAEGLECLPNDPDAPCNGVDCSGHGTCAVVGTSAVCDCDPGYRIPPPEDPQCETRDCAILCLPVAGDADADAEVVAEDAADADAEPEEWEEPPDVPADEPDVPADVPDDDGAEDGGPPAELNIYRAESAPVVDGDTDEFDPYRPLTFRLLGGGNSVEVRACWTDDGLYLAYRIAGDMFLNATEATPDGDVWSDDAVELFLDLEADDGGEGTPDLEFMAGDDFQLVVNALNTHADARGTSTGAVDDAWTGAWQSAVLTSGTLNDDRDTDVGWDVEIFAPWSVLGLSEAPAGGRVIGISFSNEDLDVSGTFNHMIWPAESFGHAYRNAGNWGRGTLLSPTT